MKKCILLILLIYSSMPVIYAQQILEELGQLDLCKYEKKVIRQVKRKCTPEDKQLSSFLIYYAEITDSLDFDRSIGDKEFLESLSLSYKKKKMPANSCYVYNAKGEYVAIVEYEMGLYCAPPGSKHFKNDLELIQYYIENRPDYIIFVYEASVGSTYFAIKEGKVIVLDFYEEKKMKAVPIKCYAKWKEVFVSPYSLNKFLKPKE